MDAATAAFVISQIERVLDAEVRHQINMGSLSHLKAKLGNFPGINNLTLHFGGGFQYIGLNGTEHKLGAGASIDEIRQALNIQKINELTTVKTGKPMSITGLQSGAFKSLLAEMKQEIAAAQNQGVADVKAAKDAATVEIKTTISSVKAKIESEVSDALQEFAEFTNGGPT